MNYVDLIDPVALVHKNNSKVTNKYCITFEVTHRMVGWSLSTHESLEGFGSLKCIEFAILLGQVCVNMWLKVTLILGFSNTWNVKGLERSSFTADWFSSDTIFNTQLL